MEHFQNHLRSPENEHIKEMYRVDGTRIKMSPFCKRHNKLDQGLTNWDQISKRRNGGIG